MTHPGGACLYGADSPCGRPRCCGGSSPSGRPGGSLWRRRTLWTPGPRTRRPRCSRPTSSPPPADPCGGSRTHTWWTSPRHRSASLRMPRRPRLWRGRRQTLSWLDRERTRQREREGQRQRERQSENETEGEGERYREEGEMCVHKMSISGPTLTTTIFVTANIHPGVMKGDPLGHKPFNTASNLQVGVHT